MTEIYVAPARPGLLVAYETHRAGHYIGHRHAKQDEKGTPAIVASAPGGHEYVVAEPPFARVPDGIYYQRAILRGDLKLISAEEAERMQGEIVKRHEAAAKASSKTKSTASDAGSKERGQ